MSCKVPQGINVSGWNSDFTKIFLISLKTTLFGAKSSDKDNSHIKNKNFDIKSKLFYSMYEKVALIY